MTKSQLGIKVSENSSSKRGADYLYWLFDHLKPVGVLTLHKSDKQHILFNRLCAVNKLTTYHVECNIIVIINYNRFGPKRYSRFG